MVFKFKNASLTIVSTLALVVVHGCSPNQVTVKPQTSPQDGVVLRYGYKKGDRFYAHYNLNIQGQSDSPLVGSTSESTEIEEGQIWQVLDVHNDGDTEVAVTFDFIRQHGRHGGDRFDADTRDPAHNEDFARGLRIFINKSFQFVVSNRGEVRQVRGIDILFRDFAKEVARIAGASPDASGDPTEVFEAIKPFTEIIRKSVEQSLSGMFVPFPAQPVKKGDLWESQLKLTFSTAPPLEIDTTMKFRLDNDPQSGPLAISGESLNVKPHMEGVKFRGDSSIGVDATVDSQRRLSAMRMSACGVLKSYGGGKALLRTSAIYRSTVTFRSLGAPAEQGPSTTGRS